MAAPSFRDRLLTRRGARALLSPVGLLGALAVGALGVVAGLPVWAGVVAGVGVWAVNGWRMLPRAARAERIDPFTLHDPWRRFVQEALKSRARFAQAVDRAPAGPLRDHLSEIGERVQAGVEECWLIARRGQVLVVARRGIDVADIDGQLAQLRGSGPGGSAEDPALGPLTESLEAQRAAAARLDQVIDRAQTELRLLDARLGEAVARTLELSAQASSDADGARVTGLQADVEGVVSEMEALRQALDETTAAAGGGTAGGLRPGEPPPGGPE
ncbi:MAG: hypothetical protein ACRD0R_03495 [Acidimicrobiales bacterium]